MVCYVLRRKKVIGLCFCSFAGFFGLGVPAMLLGSAVCRQYNRGGLLGLSILIGDGGVELGGLLLKKKDRMDTVCLVSRFGMMATF